MSRAADDALHHLDEAMALCDEADALAASLIEEGEDDE